MKKGILLAGGFGTRLYPNTSVVNKHLLNIYSKPMIYYSLSTLMLAGLREILIISLPEDKKNYKSLLGDGEDFGIKIFYETQVVPRGIAESILIAENFLEKDDFALILGDNLFYSESLTLILKECIKNLRGATILAYHVKNPEDYGIVEFNDKKEVKRIVEKPKKPRSNFAVTGLYFYKNIAVSYAKKIKPSNRGELEITALNNLFLKNKGLDLEILGRGVAWLDTGSFEGLLEANNFVYSIEKRQSLLINCPEEIAYRKNWINKSILRKKAKKNKNSPYGKYLERILKEKLYYL